MDFPNSPGPRGPALALALGALPRGPALALALGAPTRGPALALALGALPRSPALPSPRGRRLFVVCVDIEFRLKLYRDGSCDEHNIAKRRKSHA